MTTTTLARLRAAALAAHIRDVPASCTCPQTYRVSGAAVAGFTSAPARWLRTDTDPSCAWHTSDPDPESDPESD